MKVLAVVGSAYPLFGGAQRTSHALLRRLRAERGWDVLLATGHHRRVRTAPQGIPIETYRDVEELKTITRRERPDVLLGALEGIPDALRVATRFALPSIVSLHSFEYCAPTPDEIAAWGVSAERRYPDRDETAWVLASATRIVANSRYLGDRMRMRHGVETAVVYPELVPDDVMIARERRRGGWITGICGHRYKGADVFLALADAFPRERFLLVGDVDPALAADFAARTNVRLLGRTTTRRFLAMSKVVVVPSRWPEPFGRVAVEAMANGIPTLVSRTGGLAEIVGDGALGVDQADARLGVDQAAAQLGVDQADAPLGVDAFRDPEAWIEALRPLLGSAEHRAEHGALGRTLAAPFMDGAATRTFGAMIDAVAAAATPDFDRRFVAVLGGTRRATAYSLVNAHWTRALARDPDTRVLDVETAAEVGRALPDVVLHHNYSEHFADAAFPDAGALAAVRTWDFGPYPPAWARRIDDAVDRLLVYSRAVRRHAIASGIPASKVRVVPLGVDDAVFTPTGPTHPLATTKRFRFLFVGAPVARKGADVLLEAYRRAFGPDDDVCLVIKDHPHDLFYEGEAIRDRIRAAAADPHGPAVEYLCELLPADGLAALYRSCDVGVFPYRAEGFCLPILEAMASGLPSIVPRFGAALDFCSARTSLLMPVRRISLPVGRSLAFNTLGFREEVEDVEFCETPIDTLVEQLRRARALPAARRARLAAAGVEVAGRFSWEASTTRLLACVRAAEAGGVPVRVRRARERATREQARLEVAKALFFEAATPS